MEWIKNNYQFVLIFVLLAGLIFMPMLTLTKDKCVLVALEDKATVKLPSGIEMTGPASYRSYAKDCGLPKEL